MSSTISLTTTTPAPSTTSTTTTTTTTTAPTRDPERMDSRLRGRPERPRFVPTEQSAVEDAGLFDYYGDAMFGFGDYDGTDYQTETSTVNNRPSADVNQQRSGGTGGYCRVCHGQDPTTCRSQPAGKSIELIVNNLKHLNYSTLLFQSNVSVNKMHALFESLVLR